MVHSLNSHIILLGESYLRINCAYTHILCVCMNMYVQGVHAYTGLYPCRQLHMHMSRQRVSKEEERKRMLSKMYSYWCNKVNYPYITHVYLPRSALLATKYPDIPQKACEGPMSTQLHRQATGSSWVREQDGH